MVRWLLSAISLLLLTPQASVAQADGCRGALEALNRVKEQITPRLSASTKQGNERLQVMQSTLERGTRVCKEFPELWYYLAVLSERLGQDKDAQYAREKLERFKEDGRWDPKLEFDPFTMPPVPQRAPAASPPMLATALASSPVGRKWALVVGIDEFADTRAEKLDYAVKDSKDFADFLRDPQGGRFDPKHVFYLANSDATIKGLREQLGKIRLHAKPDDLVVIYIASHGSAREMDPNGVSYIVANDTDLDNPATLYSTSLQMIDLVQVVNRDFQAKSVVLILDTCFSGDALTGGAAGPAENAETAPFSVAFDNLKLGRGRAVLTASRSNERSWEMHGGGKQSNGYFTHYLLEVLRETHGEESLSHVFSDVSARVASRVRADLSESQNPTFEFSDEASGIVLGIPEPVNQ